MISKPLAKRNYGSEKRFRWRGKEVSRLEGFSDAVFAFAVTLIVVSLEVPKTFNELYDTLFPSIFAFAICFALLYQIWSLHYTYFRRYGLEDKVTRVLTAALLFVVLFYVYPLKFLFLMLAKGVFLGQSMVLVNGKPEEMATPQQLCLLMIIYGIGYLATMGIFALLYYHAYRQQDTLELDEQETSATKQTVIMAMILSSVALISISFAIWGAVTRAGSASALSGFSYVLITPFLLIERIIVRRNNSQKNASLRAHPSQDIRQEEGVADVISD